MTSKVTLQPFLLSDTLALVDLFAQSIEELTADDYDEEQRLAWASTAADAEAFARRLEKMLTLVARIDGEYAGFAALKDNAVIDLLYVHPFFIRQGVGSTLADALERLAAARGAMEISVDASETAEEFFEQRGYAPQHRNSVPRGDAWLTNTTMKKSLAGAVPRP